MDSGDPTHPSFWDERYRANRTRWDLGRVPGMLEAWLKSAKPGAVLIPGCGSGWEIAAFEKAGWRVTAVDFSSAAVERARKVVTRPSTRLLRADFFSADFGRSFDAVYERTFLCSMPEAGWPDYSLGVKRALKRGGELVGFFLYGPRESEPPPFPIPAQPVDCFLAISFELIEDRASSEALPLFGKRERWQRWTALPGRW